MKETSREERGVIGFGLVRRILRVNKRLRDYSSARTKFVMCHDAFARLIKRALGF